MYSFKFVHSLTNSESSSGSSESWFQLQNGNIKNKDFRETKCRPSLQNKKKESETSCISDTYQSY